MRKRRDFLTVSGLASSFLVVGCIGSGGPSTIPVTVRNDDDDHHTIAVIVTDEDGNTDYFAETVWVKLNEQVTLEKGIPIPDSTPQSVVARVLLDNGHSDEVGVTLDFEEQVDIVIASHNRVERG